MSRLGIMFDSLKGVSKIGYRLVKPIVEGIQESRLPTQVSSRFNQLSSFTQKKLSDTFMNGGSRKLKRKTHKKKKLNKTRKQRKTRNKKHLH